MRKKLFFALACAAIGFFVVSAAAPGGGARGVSRWHGDFLGQSGFALGAVGAGIGLVIGLVLAMRRD